MLIRDQVNNIYYSINDIRDELNNLNISNNLINKAINIILINNQIIENIIEYKNINNAINYHRYYNKVIIDDNDKVITLEKLVRKDEEDSDKEVDYNSDEDN